MHEAVLRAISTPNLLKSLLAGGSLLLVLPVAQAQVAQFTWPVYEPFSEYVEDTSRLGGNTSSNYWNFGNGGTPGVASYIITNAAAMSFPALPVDSNSVPKGVTSQSVLNTSADRGAWFTPQSGTVYVSFLFNYFDNLAATVDRLFFNLVYNAPNAIPGGSFTQYRTTIWLTPDNRLKIHKNYSAGSTVPFSPTSAVLVTNVTHFIVLRYSRVAGDNDRADLWIDPMPFGDGAMIPPPTLTTTNGANLAGSINGVMLMNRSLPAYTTYDFWVDEIRVGDTWAGVTPLATPAPGPMFAVTGGGTVCLGDPVSVGLNGSVSTNDYLLYTNGVYSATIAGTGSAVDFGPQTTIGSYSVLASNTLNANVGWMSNSAVVAIKAPATIVADPAPVTVPTNNRAEFRVSATGDLLSYQWFKDGTATPLADDAHITGSTTSDLVVWPAGAADIGGYYCRVSDTCGHVQFSTTNVLNLGTPNDLVWIGDGFNICAWNAFAANAEWSGGSVFFSPGDNVTFDDTYTYLNDVSLNGVLTPSSIKISASRNYAWAGTGTIAGSAALVKNGPGTLILNNNAANGYTNTYSGGTVISNGIVNITNGWFNFGTGPVTLAGGTLESWNKGSGAPGAAGGLPNDLHVTANSTWLIDRTGDQCAGLLGTLSGNNGTAFYITNSATLTNSFNRIRFGGEFTNGLAFDLSVNVLATNSAQDIACYNSTGAQVYNGSISGQNGGFAVAGGGAAYLNGANTFGRETLVLGGLLAGSGSVNSRLVVTNGATVGGGSQTAIGTFTVNNDVVLYGNASIRVDKSLAQSNDLISATGYITNAGAGTVTVTNIGASALAAGNRFKIFSGPVLNGAALSVTGGDVAWVNDLETDGSIQVASAIANYPTNISYSVSVGTLDITWPGTHLGWVLQSQTNSLGAGVSTNWHDIPISVNGTNYPVNVDPTNPPTFYRLRHP